MDFNYATVEVEKAEDDDIKVVLSIKNYFNSNVQQKVVFINKELTFSKEMTMHNQMCTALHSYHRKCLLVMRIIDSLVAEKKVW